MLLLSGMMLQGCGSTDPEEEEVVQTPDDDNDSSQQDDEEPSEESLAILESWIINNTEVSAVLLEDGAGILTNVQSAVEATVDQVDYVRVQATGIPDYQVTMTQEHIDDLNNRPKASTDFRGMTSTTLAEVGDVIDFGEDIGYKNTPAQGCVTDAGMGYWPPGPGCPLNQNKDGYFPLEPVSTDEDCETRLGAIGYAVNGVSIYNWGDGASYNNEGAWQTLAPFAEVYDVDICGGHATSVDGGADYHHHFYSDCWGEVAGEDEQGHSELIGFAADGYPVYGPWHDTGVIAKTSWVARDYSAGSATGCGANGKRTCVLVDPYDVSQGTEAASANGPDTNGSHTSLSGNVFDTTSGFYYEDYYFDSALAALGGAYLDEHNGHEHGDLGYHYHVTIASASDSTPAFPFTIGPTLKGDVPAEGLFNCTGGQMPPP